ncbi:hypothetical protein DFH06DRAFT_1125796 [Mycena polygramma]|nr:hypothetical protein DFH06DRAFT_1125796 [Mycena polygramma]
MPNNHSAPIWRRRCRPRPLGPAAGSHAARARGAVHLDPETTGPSASRPPAQNRSGMPPKEDARHASHQDVEDLKTRPKTTGPRIKHFKTQFTSEFKTRENPRRFKAARATALLQARTDSNSNRHGCRGTYPMQRLAASVAGVEEGISRDEDRIWELEEEVSFLQNRVCVLEENKRILASLSAPIRKVPPELIQHIFELAGGVGTNHFNGAQTVSGATRLSAVCAQWRAIAHATPRIWATFVVDIYSDGRGGTLKAIERHLQFARDAELHLDLRATKKKAAVVHHELLELFAAHASRWCFASFKIARITKEAQDVLAAALDNTPCLKSLHIRSPDPQCSDIKIEFFRSCPALRELSIMEYNPTTAYTIPWAQLTSIHFASSHTRNINAVLDLCPNLTSVSLIVPTTYSLEREEPGLVPRTLQIHTLRIQSRSTPGSKAMSGVLAVCAGLTLPRLKTLSIVSNAYRKYYDPEDETRFEQGCWPQAAVEGMLVRSACTLKTLRLEGIPLDPLEALALLRLVPHATTVSLHECKTVDPDTLSYRRQDKVYMDTGANHFITKELLDSLCAKTPTPLLPRLHRFELKVNVDFAMDAYMVMIRSRFPGRDAARVLDSGVDRLDAVSLTVVSHLDMGPDWDSQPFLALKKEGLLVKYDDGCDEVYGYNDKVVNSEVDSDVSSDEI